MQIMRWIHSLFNTVINVCKDRVIGNYSSQHRFASTINHKCSKGELACREILDRKGLKYIAEFRLPTLPRRRFDFMFSHARQRYLLEFDGRQHFVFTPHFHKNVETYLEKQEVDVVKTQAALDAKYRIVRVDYTQMNNIEQHLDSAFRSRKAAYYSNVELYRYITQHPKYRGPK